MEPSAMDVVLYASILQEANHRDLYMEIVEKINEIIPKDANNADVILIMAAFLGANATSKDHRDESVFRASQILHFCQTAAKMADTVEARMSTAEVAGHA